MIDSSLRSVGMKKTLISRITVKIAIVALTQKSP
jgi:hypothetical protein